jgi:hypothetical protein
MKLDLNWKVMKENKKNGEKSFRLLIKPFSMIEKLSTSIIRKLAYLKILSIN